MEVVVIDSFDLRFPYLVVCAAVAEKLQVPRT